MGGGEMTDTNAKTAIGWIGVGKMGAPMVRGLLGKGHAVRVFDVNAEAAAGVAGDGAVVAQSTAELAAGSALVFSIVPHDAALDAVASEALGAMAPGSVYVDMSTVSPGASARVAAAASDAGVAYLRAPVSGSTALAEAAKLTVLASGDAHAWEAVSPLLPAFAAKSFYLGSGDEARYMKLVLNTMVGSAAAITGEALRLGEAGGLDAGAMMEVINESAVASPLLAYKTDAIVSGDFAPAFSLDQMIKDMTLILDAAKESGCDMSAVDGILGQYREAGAAGFGAQDFFALIDWQRRR